MRNDNKINNNGKKSFVKSSKCPECGEGIMKKKIRRNYPFGRKSKVAISKWQVCSKCKFSRLEK